MYRWYIYFKFLTTHFTFSHFTCVSLPVIKNIGVFVIFMIPPVLPITITTAKLWFVLDEFTLEFFSAIFAICCRCLNIRQITGINVFKPGRFCYIVCFNEGFKTCLFSVIKFVFIIIKSILNVSHLLFSNLKIKIIISIFGKWSK